jgi:tetratricopeptide (TPR) repeat protein
LGTLLTGFVLLALIDGPEGAVDQLPTISILAVAIGLIRWRPRSGYLPALLAMAILQWPLVVPDDSIAAALTGRSYGLLKTAEQAAMSGQVEPAAKLYERAIRLNPRNAKAWAASAALDLAMGKPDVAHQKADVAVTLFGQPYVTLARHRSDNTLNMALYVAGKSAVENGDFDEARARLTQGAQADPGNGLVHWELAALYARGDQWEEALKAYERVITLAGSVDRTMVAQAYRFRGEALFRLGRPGDAITSLQVSLGRNPTDAVTRLDLGAVKMSLGRINEAVIDLEAARAALKASGDPAGAQADGLLNFAFQSIYADYAGRGKALLDSGDFAAAIPWLRRALPLASRSQQAELQMGIGRACWELGRYEESIAAYQASVEAAPGNPRALHNLGWALGASGQFQEAEDKVRKAISLYPKGDPELSSAHSLLGLILEVTGRREQARLEYLAALLLDPSNAKALTNLQRVQASQVKPGGQ